MDVLQNKVEKIVEPLLSVFITSLFIYSLIYLFIFKIMNKL